MGDDPRIRLFLVDDRPAVLQGLRMWLALEPDLVIVGEAADGVELCRLLASLRPDVVLMDLEMPRRDGIEAIVDVHVVEPCLPVVILSLHDDLGNRTRARVAGAAAFVAKHELEPLLVSTIREVARKAHPGQFL